MFNYFVNECISLNINLQEFMFVAQSLAPFSADVMKNSQQTKKVQENLEKQQQSNRKRPRSKSQEKQLEKCNAQQDQHNQKNQKQKQDQDEIAYLSFLKGDKILVRETYENGWWFGNTLTAPQIKGYFPSTYVKVGAKPPPPKKQAKQQNSQDIKVYDPKKEQEQDWISKQLKQVKAEPIKSQYYHGITGYKMVKVDQKNQNILKGNHVKFDVATGLASVPIKDQSPTSKAVRQMGYYFDYHQWAQERNKRPPKRARPDIRKKKEKKLNLKMMD